MIALAGNLYIRRSGVLAGLAAVTVAGLRRAPAGNVCAFAPLIRRHHYFSVSKSSLLNVGELTLGSGLRFFCRFGLVGLGGQNAEGREFGGREFFVFYLLFRLGEFRRREFSHHATSFRSRAKLPRTWRLRTVSIKLQAPENWSELLALDLRRAGCPERDIGRKADRVKLPGVGEPPE